jgi:photosystem II stability/assembly factor-like uncharacterized protein
MCIRSAGNNAHARRGTALETVSDQLAFWLQFFDGKHGYGIRSGRFFRTNDAGCNRTESQIADVTATLDAFFLSSSVGWLSGGNGSGHLDVFRSRDGGDHGDESRLPAQGDLDWVQDLFFIDENRGWLIAKHVNDGGSSLFSSLKGGKDWTREPDASFPGASGEPILLRFVSDRTGIIFDGRVKRLTYTLDAGAHWQSRDIPEFVSDCQIFEGDLICSYANGFGVLTLHAKLGITMRPAAVARLQQRATAESWNNTSGARYRCCEEFFLRNCLRY